jgi:hypothetical protein
MASNFVGGFAKGFNQSYQLRRAETRQLENDLLRDTWSRFHDSLESRKKQQSLESAWANAASLYAEDDEQKQVYMKLLQSGVTTPDKLGDFLKENEIQKRSSSPEAPEGPPLVTEEMAQLQQPALPQHGMDSELAKFNRRGSFADPEAKRTNAMQNRAVDKIAKKTGMDPRMVREALYGGESINSPSQILDYNIVPRTSSDVKLMSNITKDNYLALASVEYGKGNTKMGDSIMKIGGAKADEYKDEMKSRSQPYHEVWAYVRDKETGELIKGRYLFNGDYIKPLDGKAGGEAPISLLDSEAMIVEGEEQLNRQDAEQLNKYTTPVLEKREAFQGLLYNAQQIKLILDKNPDASTQSAKLINLIDKLKTEGDVAYKQLMKLSERYASGEINIDAAVNEAKAITGEKLGYDFFESGAGAGQLQTEMISLTFKFLGSLGQTGHSAGEKDFSRTLASITDPRAEVMLNKVKSLVKSGYQSVEASWRTAYDKAEGTIYSEHLPNNLGEDVREFITKGTKDYSTYWLGFDTGKLAEETAKSSKGDRHPDMGASDPIKPDYVTQEQWDYLRPEEKALFAE